MANIMPISELIKDPDSISKICHSQDEPVFLTKNGYGELVVMSIDQYDLLKTQAEANLARAKINLTSDSFVTDENTDNKETDDSTDDSGGIKKLPLTDVVDILKEELKKQQLVDVPKSRKRFP